MSMDSPRLGLREQAHEVRLVQVENHPYPSLGRSYPPMADLRLHTVLNWDVVERGPRSGKPATVDMPLDQRSQTILSHQVAPAVEQKLDRSFFGIPALRIQC
jgi:hypothetical protein